MPKTNVTWDRVIALHYLKTLSPVRQLSSKPLTLMCVTLSRLGLLTGQRGQSLQFIDIRKSTVLNSAVKISYGDFLKTHYQQTALEVKAFAPGRRLCVVAAVKEHLERGDKTV